MLTSAAEASLKVLRTEVAAHLAQPWPRRDLGGLKLRLARAFQDIVAERCATAKMLLTELVRQEAGETAEILTIGGLAAQPPRLEAADPDPEREIKRLAALPLLERSLAAGLLVFTREVVVVLQENERRPLEPAALDQRLTRAGHNWRNRLAATSATLVMAVAGRARGAVRAALRRPSPSEVTAARPTTGSRAGAGRRGWPGRSDRIRAKTRPALGRPRA